jgi:hypothetical protein
MSHCAVCRRACRVSSSRVSSGVVYQTTACGAMVHQLSDRAGVLGEAAAMMALVQTGRKMSRVASREVLDRSPEAK